MGRTASGVPIQPSTGRTAASASPVTAAAQISPSVAALPAYLRRFP